MHVFTRKRILFAVLAATIAFVALDPRGEWLFNDQRPSASTKAGEPGAAGDSKGQVVNESAGRFALRERVPLGETPGALFESRAWQPVGPQASAKPAAPVVPPMPYRFAGKLLKDGKLQVFLSKGDATIPVQEGETLDGKYRVESIGEDRITLVYLPLKHKETIPVFSLIQNGGAQAQPVQQARPSKVTPPAIQESAAPVPAPGSNGPPRGPIPTASVVSGR